MSWSRWLLVVLGVLALAASSVYARGSAAPRFAPDLIGNLTGGHLVATDAARLYDVDAQQTWQREVTGAPLFLDLYISPPHTAVLFAPFAALPFRAALASFTALSLLAFLAALLLARPLAPDTRTYVIAALAFAASEPFAETLVIGQTSALSLLVWIGGVRLALARRDFIAGLVLGLGLFKPQLVVFVPVVLVATRRWRTLAGFATSAAALLAIGVVCAGPRAYVAWLALLRSPAYASVRAQNQFHMSSIEAMVHGLVPDALATSVVPMEVHVAAAAALTIVLFLVAARDRLQTTRELATWGAAALVTSVAAPHFIVYDAVLLLLPALVVARIAPVHRPTRDALFAAFVLAWLAPVLEPVMRHTTWPLHALSAPFLPVPLLLLLAITCARGNRLDRCPPRPA